LPEAQQDCITISEAIMGNVVSAGMGQAPTRQAVMFAGLPERTVCTTINKVCASGMKSVMLASQMLATSTTTGTTTSSSSNHQGQVQAVLAGGFESMTNIPHYLPTLRSGTSLGNSKLIDGVIYDGLWDQYNDQHMGMCGEKCAKEYSITRDDQDAYTIESYRRAQAAWQDGVFEEVIPVQVPLSSLSKGGDPIMVRQDEEPTFVKMDKIRTLKPAFDKENGTITAANASSLNDGACAIILMKEQDAVDNGIHPLARILGFGDAEQQPVDFPTTPSLAVPVALTNAGCSLDDIDYHEINEAFAVVALANMRLMKLDHAKVNVFGGAVSLGHPIGMSGARIIGALYDVLKHKDGSIGCASICNGGGGASAIVIERMN
jgi:acetyl-CoA C-acetyltransferase